jgi:hypothetical protein
MTFNDWLRHYGSTGDAEEDVRRWLEAAWAQTRRAYQQAGGPLGTGERALELWVEFGTLTTSS